MPLRAKTLIKKARTVFQKKPRESLFCCLDAPEPRGISPGMLNAFSGWAYSTDERRITGVEVYQNGTLLGTCDYGLEREDVYKAIPHFPQALKSGFFGWIPIQKQASGPLHVYAIDENGHRHTIARRQLARRVYARNFFKRIPPRDNGDARTSLKNPVREFVIPRQILIAGLPKTGTTGLFFKIGNSLISCGGPALQTKPLFEPTAYCGPENQRVLAKIIIAKKDSLSIWGDGRKLRWTDFEDFKNFGRKILLHRDPRDRLISSLLYSTQDAAFKKRAESLQAFLRLLQKKEAAPDSVSLLELVEVRLRPLSNGLQTWKTRLADMLNYFLDFRRQQGGFFHYTYESFVRGNTKDLEEFLGFPLSGDAIVGRELKRVERTKNSGDWQNWFTEEDIRFFRPVFRDFMQKLRYNDLWALPERQIILPAHGSEYVKKITRL